MDKKEIQKRKGLNQKKVSDLAGAWKMTDKEAEELLESLKKGWNKKR